MRDYSNENIDKDRTKYNYSLLERDISSYMYFKKRIKELTENKTKTIRKDANVLTSLVITVPLNDNREPMLNEEEEKDFFNCCFEFVSNQFGLENIITCKIHKDETNPHCHISFIPVGKNKNHEDCISCKQVINKQMLKDFHKNLQEYLNSNLDFECPILKESKITDSYLSIKDLKQKTKLEKLESEYSSRLEYCQNAVNERLQKMQSTYDKQRERSKEMCIRLEAHKKELKEIMETNEKSFFNILNSIGTKMPLGKFFTNKELEMIENEAKIIEVHHNENVKLNDIVEKLNQQHNSNMKGMQSKIDFLKDNIDILQDKVSELEMYKKYVNDTNRDNSFESYKNNHVIVYDKELDIDLKTNSYGMVNKPKIISVDEYKKRPKETKVKENIKDLTDFIEL